MFGARLKKERLKNQMSQEDLAEKLGVKKNTIWNWENEKSYPNALQMMDFLDFGLNVQFILTGKYPTDIQSANDEFEMVPFYDVKVSAGFGRNGQGVYEPDSYLAFRKDWLHARGLKPKDLCCVQAHGDSMSPTIGSGDTLLIDMSQHVPRDGHIYVIRSADTLWVKRIQRQIGNSLLLISDNDTYPPMTLAEENHHDVEIIGQVVNVSKDIS